MNPLRHRTTERDQAYIERLLARISPANQPFARRFLYAKEAEGLRTSSRRNYANTLARLDERLIGTPIESATPDQLADFVNYVHAKWSIMTGWGHTIRLRHVLRWLYDQRDEDVPRPIRRALRRRSMYAAAEPQPIGRGEFEALLAAAAMHRDAANTLRVQALLWTLWDSGFRLSEVINLRVGSVEPDGDGGATLRLVPQVEGLKTGVRSVYVVECVNPIVAWLGMHPQGRNPDAPLFPTPRDPLKEPWNAGVEDLIRRLAKLARLRRIHPHLFRHTRATRMAESGAVEAEMRAYFGWSRNSEMPAKYIHIAKSKLAERVRREAGLDALGKSPTTAEVPCRYCAEPIKAAAIKCRHCGEFVKPRASHETRQTPATEGLPVES